MQQEIQVQCAQWIPLTFFGLQFSIDAPEVTLAIGRHAMRGYCFGILCLSFLYDELWGIIQRQRFTIGTNVWITRTADEHPSSATATNAILHKRKSCAVSPA